MSADSGPGRREVAYRLFAAEFDDATLSYSESDEERAPNYVVTPTGARVNRLFAVGVLTEVERVNEDVLRARIADPTGAFVTYAGQYQPEAMATLDRTEPPAFVSITGKARTFSPEDSDRVFTSVRPEAVNAVDAGTRDRWVVTAAEATLRRVARCAEALAADERGEALRVRLLEAGAPEDLAAGVPLALDHYGTTTAYLEALRTTAVEALEVVAGERDSVSPLDLAPDEVGEGAASVGPLPAAVAATASSGTGTSPDAAPPSDEGTTTAEAAATDAAPTDATTAGAADAAEATEPTDASTGSTATTAGTDGTADAGPGAEVDPVSGAGEPEAPASGSNSEPEPEPEPESLGGDAPGEAPDGASTGDDPDLDAGRGDAAGGVGGFDDEVGGFDDEVGDFDDAGDAAELAGFDDGAPGDEAVGAGASDDVSAAGSDGSAGDDAGGGADAPEADAGAEPAADAGDERYEFDDAERERVEDEYGTEFSTGTEVDEPGEADIDVPDAEELAAMEGGEADAGATERVTDDDPGRVEGDAAAGGTEPDATTDVADAPTADPTASGGGEGDDGGGEPAAGADVEAGDVDLEDAAVALMDELDDGDGAEREAVVDGLVERYGATPDAAEEAIQEALMDGKCYEPGDGRLTAI
jgi:hypothetical protein